MNDLFIGSWYSNQIICILKETTGFGYQFHLMTGKTNKEAYQKSAKELRRLAKLCDERAKDE